MISTFDLILMGSLVSAGGVLFLRHGKRLHFACNWLDGRQSADPAFRDTLERSAAIAGTRWLTVGVLTFFVGCIHGADDGYLYGPWSDILFHLIFVPAAWVMTAYRMKQATERSTGRTHDGPLSIGSLNES